MKRYPLLFGDDFPRPRERTPWPTPQPRAEAVPPPAPTPPPAPPPPSPPPAPPPADDRAALREATARLDAARGRVERDAARVLDETRGQLVEQLLPVLDSLDRSIATGGEDGNRQIRAQLESVLARFGLERFDADLGSAFDPNEHEAVAVVDVAPERAGTVIAQWEAGYRHAGRLLRPARVQVGRHRG